MSEIERQIPHSHEAEQGVLGCIFLSPHDCMAECLEKIKPGHEVFYDIRHRVIYKVLTEMYEAKSAIDVITVQQALKDKQQLESVGGIAYLATLPDTVPSAANLSFYLGVVIGKYLCRSMIEFCNDKVNEIYECPEEVEKLLDSFEADALRIRDTAVSGSQELTIKELTLSRIDYYEQCKNAEGKIMGLPTGYPDLDVMLNGLKGGDMIVLAARPSMGKTSLAINIAENIAIDQKTPVGVFSLEMSAEALVGRMISSRSRVNERELVRATASEGDMQRVAVGATRVANAPIFIDDRAGLTVTQIKAKARRMKQRHKIKMLVIDYMQLIKPAKSRQNRQEEMAEISTGIKSLAKELDVPVIAICQLNRELEKDRERKPRISDLRESGQIEQDADVIGMLYAADPAASAQNPDTLAVNLLIGKQRNGPTGDVHLVFRKQFTRFESVSKIEPEIKQPPRSWLPKE